MTEILVMSFALGMDALSLSIGIGLQGIKRRKALQLCLSIALFHVTFTIFGIAFGSFIGRYLGNMAATFSALLLMGLGLHMLYHTFFGDEEKTKAIDTTLTMFLFSAGVSVDALSVGFSLGLRSTAYGVVSAIAFGLSSMIMCGIGLAIGKKFRKSVGTYGEIVGAIILICCGLNFIV